MADIASTEPWQPRAFIDQRLHELAERDSVIQQPPGSEPSLPEGLPEGIGPGDAWVCGEGHRHFLCFGCYQVFTSNPGFDEGARQTEATAIFGAPVSEEDRISACDACQPKILAWAKATGRL